MWWKNLIVNSIYSGCYQDLIFWICNYSNFFILTCCNFRRPTKINTSLVLRGYECLNWHSLVKLCLLMLSASLLLGWNGLTGTWILMCIMWKSKCLQNPVFKKRTSCRHWQDACFKKTRKHYFEINTVLHNCQHCLNPEKS